MALSFKCFGIGPDVPSVFWKRAWDRALLTSQAERFGNENAGDRESAMSRRPREGASARSSDLRVFFAPSRHRGLCLSRTFTNHLRRVFRRDPAFLPAMIILSP